MVCLPVKCLDHRDIVSDTVCSQAGSVRPREAMINHDIMICILEAIFTVFVGRPADSTAVEKDYVASAAD